MEISKEFLILGLVIAVAVAWTLIFMAPLRNKVAGDGISKNAFIEKITGDGKMVIMYAGRLYQGEYFMRPVEGEKLKVVFILDGSTEEMTFDGKISPYKTVTVEIPLGAKSYVIYYEGQRLRGGVLE